MKIISSVFVILCNSIGLTAWANQLENKNNEVLSRLIEIEMKDALEAANGDVDLAKEILESKILVLEKKGFDRKDIFASMNGGKGGCASGN